MTTLWKFETKNFIYKFNALPDYDVDMSFDEDGTIQDDINNGLLECFMAHITVRLKQGNILLAEDYLGGCIYKNPLEFIDHRGNKGKYGSYFRDMIKSVTNDARKEFKEYKKATYSINLKE